MGDLSRRRMLFGGAALGAGAVLAGCTSNNPSDSNNDNGAQVKTGSSNDAAGKAVTIGFSAPAADHGWIGAITANAKAQAAKFSDVTFKPVDAGKDAPAQIAALQSLIQSKPDAIVLLPQDGAQLTAVGKQAMDAGIAVINLDREFTDPAASFTLIKGDNCGMGVSAGHYVGEKLKGNPNAIIAEVAGIDELQLTKDRSKGFADTLKNYGLKVSHRVAAQFTVQSGQSQTANLLQAAPKLDAVWNHDDDQGIGVLAAIQQAGRSEFFMVGGAGSANAMRAIQEDNTVLKATVTYSPSMASSAVSIARLVAQGRGLSDFAEREVPASITLASATITKENVGDYLPLGFES